MAAKISISIADPKLLAWARRRALRDGSSLSAVFAEAVRVAQQQEARDRFLDWAGSAGELTSEREAEIRAELQRPAAARARRRRRPAR
jgi:hypothetical protein